MIRDDRVSKSRQPICSIHQSGAPFSAILAAFA